MDRWSRALNGAAALPSATLSDMLRQMRGLRDEVSGLASMAEAELLTRGDGSGGIAAARPEECDWAERPLPWRQRLVPRGHVEVASPLPLGGGMTLFHDATRSDVSVRQQPNTGGGGGGGGPVFGLVLEVYRFDGSFVSLVQDLPDAAVSGLTLGHVIGVHLDLNTEQPVEVYARLNVQHGPNTEQIVRQVARDGSRHVAEFDLAYTKINEKRIERVWLDLIFEAPEMNRIDLADMVLLRAPRADI